MQNVTLMLVVVGRALLGGYFLQAALRNSLRFAQHTQTLTVRGVPQPQLALSAGLVLQAVGGALVVVGIWPALGAAGLIVFTIAAAALYHNFWDYQGEDRTTHLNACLSNAGFVGALLLVIAIG
jgi:putative oxidoreductase